jgi:amylosucrase
LISSLHGADINLCADFVINHTSDDHDWARQALAGSKYHQGLFHMFDGRVEPEAYEASLPEVFPHMAPGNFTWRSDIEKWVWTTFREFQWDLNWSNPDVMCEIGDVALALANLGVDVLRLDAIAFTWKRRSCSPRRLLGRPTSSATSADTNSNGMSAIWRTTTS